MGARGPAPTPTAILNHRGSPRAARRKGEPRPAVGAPLMPMHLTPEAKIVWEQLVAQLEPLGVLSQIDGGALERYCSAFARWRKAAAFIEKNGEAYPIKTEAGDVKYLVQWPQVATYNKLAAMLLRLEQEYGLTPASRSRINILDSGEQPDTQKSRFFIGPAA